MLERIALIALGGALGSVLRYACLNVGERWSAAGVPLAVLAVNVLGGLAAGGIAAWLAGRDGSYDALRLLFLVGLLGGFTTFSAFTLEGLELLRSGALARAGLHAAAHVLCSLAAAALGVWAVRSALS
jgi:CrcB protein